jgi:hypothetical protein
MSVVVVISQHLLNVFIQLANKRGFKKKKKKKNFLTALEVLHSVARRRAVTETAYSGREFSRFS